MIMLRWNWNWMSLNNLPKSENAKQPQCSKDKEDAIVEALKAFQMI